MRARRFGGLLFNNARTNQLTDIRVRDQFADVERLLIKDRIRYDSPRFAGLQISGSFAADERWDTAIRFRPSIENFTFVVASAYQNKPFGDIAWRWDIGGGVRHESSGINLSGGFVKQEVAGGRISDNFTVKAGWLASLFDIGNTAVSIDYTLNQNIRRSGNDAMSIGAIVFQNWDPYGFKFYTGARLYDITMPGVETDRILVFPLGALFSF